MIVTSVSICGLQRQLNKDKTSCSNEVAKSQILHIEHTNAHDKIILMRTFLPLPIPMPKEAETSGLSDTNAACSVAE